MGSRRCLGCVVCVGKHLPDPALAPWVLCVVVPARCGRERWTAWTDKCQVLCLVCHSRVTRIEGSLTCRSHGSPDHLHISKMQTCQQCNFSFVKKHTCKAGACTLCGAFFKNVGKHRCPLAKFQGFPALKLHNFVTCCSCLKPYPKQRMQKWRYKDVNHDALDLCNLCFTLDADVQIRLRETSTAVYEYAKWKFGDPVLRCVFCGVDVHGYELSTFRRMYGYEFDHKNPEEKRNSVGKMIFEGCPVNQILDEVDRCRVLCIHCHDLKTTCEQQMGIPKVLKYQNAEQKKQTLQMLITQTMSHITAKLSRVQSIG